MAEFIFGFILGALLGFGLAIALLTLIIYAAMKKRFIRYAIVTFLKGLGVRFDEWYDNRSQSPYQHR